MKQDCLLSFRLSVDMDEALRTAARNRGTLVSDLVRNAIAKDLGLPVQEPEQRWCIYAIYQDGSKRRLHVKAMPEAEAVARVEKLNKGSRRAAIQYEAIGGSNGQGQG